MTRTASYCLFVWIAFSSAAAHADFVVRNDQATGEPSGAPQPSVVAGVVADAPHLDPGDREAPTPARPVVARQHLVLGFGDQVPLSFACRQIVPRGVKVSYGPGVDPATPVTWKGGDTWRLVLARTIRPLGLHMVAAGMSLQIRQ